MNSLENVIWLDRDGIPHLRNSERGTMNKCPQQWWWSWRDGLRPKETAKALWFGQGIHEALAHYYAPGKKRRKDFIDKWREFADGEAEYVRVNIGAIDEDAWVEARMLGEHMLGNYVKEWRHDRNWDVIATEQPFSLTIPVVPRGTKVAKHSLIAKVIEAYGPAFILNGTVDGVYRDTDDRRVKLMEHKTAGSISTRHLPMDNQAGTYWMVAYTLGVGEGWLAKNEQIRDITYNFLRKAVADERPRDAQGYCTNKPVKDAYIAAIEAAELTDRLPSRKSDWTVVNLSRITSDAGIIVLGERSKTQPPPLFERHAVRKTRAQRKTQLNRLQAEYVRMAATVLGELEVTKSPSRDTCPMCPFNEMCELHESGGDWMTFRNALYRATDPYEDHRANRKSA